MSPKTDPFPFSQFKENLVAKKAFILETDNLLKQKILQTKNELEEKVNQAHVIQKE